MNPPDTNSAPPTDANAKQSTQSAWWRRWLVNPLMVLGGLIAAGTAAGFLILGLGLCVAYPNLPEVHGLAVYQPKIPLRVYASDGTLIGEFGEERRRFQPISEIPKVMRDAVLAIEDARFYQHGGVDYLGILRAGLANFRESRSQGASTITMQVARNFYLPSEKTFTRKIYEILLAMKIENKLSKNQILELYMNQIFLGQRAYGFGAASDIYFGKPLKDITVAEAAMLAGLPKAPSAYNPIRNPRRATIRQQHIIDRMFENGFITAEQRDEAKAEELVYRRKPPIHPYAEYVAEAARGLMHEQYGADAYTRGLNVYTSIDLSEQLVASKALRKGLLDFDRRQPWRGPEAHVELPDDPKQADITIAEKLEDHPDSDTLRAAVVTRVVTHEGQPRVMASLQTGEQITLSGDGLKVIAKGLTDQTSVKHQVRKGSVIRVEQDKSSQWFVRQLPEVEGAFVALDPRTGFIRAMVGGFDFERNKFNHVTQAWRQPGSSFKPFIYSSAIEKGFTPATVVNDAPLFYPASSTGSRAWEPKNYDGKFEGPMTLRRALAKSKNMVSIRVLESVGTKYAQSWLTNFGFDADKHLPYLPMALGAGSVTPLQMANAYAVFANGGYRVNPALVLKVTDNRGQILAEHRPNVLDESMRSIDARNAFLMSSLLQEVTRSGTAAKAQSVLKRSDLHGKTGTTNDSMDAWFAGYHPHLVAVVWIGYDQPRKLGDRETGGGLALPVWIDYMTVALKNEPVSELTPPEGVVNIGGEWFYEEYTPSNAVRHLASQNEDQGGETPPPTSSSEKTVIMEMFGEP